MRKENEFVLKQQFPDADTARKRAQSSLNEIELNTPCPHMLPYLPHELDLSFCKSSVDSGEEGGAVPLQASPTGASSSKKATGGNSKKNAVTVTTTWVLRNPVHALHLAAHLDQNGTITTLDDEYPLLYGEEQEKLMAMQIPGLHELWHPYLQPFPPKVDPKETPLVPTKSSHATPSQVISALTSPSTRTAESVTAMSKSLLSAPHLSTILNQSLAEPSKPETVSSETLLTSVTTSNLNMPSFLPDQALSSPAAQQQSSVGTVQSRLEFQQSAENSTQLPENRFWSLQTQEDQIHVLQKLILSSRSPHSASIASLDRPTSSSQLQVPLNNKSSNKKRKTEPPFANSSPKTTSAKTRSVATKSPSSSRTSLFHLGAWKKHFKPPLSMFSSQAERDDMVLRAQNRVNLWMTYFRESRQSYWRQRNARNNQEKTSRDQSGESYQFGRIATCGNSTYNEDGTLSCQLCRLSDGTIVKDNALFNQQEPFGQHKLSGDDLMHCLECNFIGCAARNEAFDAEHNVANKSITQRFALQHIKQHMLLTNHGLAVTCGSEAKVYCFKCGEYVRHQIFDQEKERIDLCHTLPWMGWKEHTVQRSFDALRFIRVDQSIFWRGMAAAYPSLISLHHIEVARLSRWRYILFRGEMDDIPDNANPVVKAFAVQMHHADRCSIAAPVGIYNLGNTCFMSAILQCLIHCPFVQKYFLYDVGHNHLSCFLNRQKVLSMEKTNKLISGPNLCFGCEVDKLLLLTLGGTIGQDVVALLTANPIGAASCPRPRFADLHEKLLNISKGEPLVLTDMLTSLWKCKGMSHLTGYEQRDAHEFFHAFLDVLGNHCMQYRARISHSISISRLNNAHDTGQNGASDDIVKQLFEGKLRSVLICQKCRSKRVQFESFVSISLPLSKEIQNPAVALSGRTRGGKLAITIEQCLRYFTLPETLSDSVECPSCGEKTPTTKQHVIAKLPPVLCLHLKRFDAASNKKVEDFVTFPIHNLNMGQYLPHWCEETTASDDFMSNSTFPSVLYNLFGTVNHFGNLQMGHYVANIKVDSTWYTCNDAHVSMAGIGNGEREVLNSEGAYLLFYVRAPSAA